MWKQLHGEEMGCKLSSSVSTSDSGAVWFAQTDFVFFCFFRSGRNSPQDMRTYQFFGLSERVLHVGEAEAGDSDELTHHRHKLVPQLLRSLPLVFQLLRVPIRERKVKESVTGSALNSVQLANGEKTNRTKKTCTFLSNKSL